MATSLEDVSAPRRTASLLRSFIGTHLRRIGNWIAVGDLVELISEAGVTSEQHPVGVVQVEGQGSADAGDPRWSGRTRAGRRMQWRCSTVATGGSTATARCGPATTGCSILFSVPESERHLRHQLRTALTWMGCGMVANGTWIGPGHLLGGDQGRARRARTAAGTSRPCSPANHEPPIPLNRAVAQWWDLAGPQRARYRGSSRSRQPIRDAGRNRRPRPAGRADVDSPAPFVDHLILVDNWRSIPYLDPGLPYDLLPADWPGQAGVDLFAELARPAGQAAARHVAAVVRR